MTDRGGAPSSTPSVGASFRRQSRWRTPIVVAMLLALALHVRVLYRAPPAVRGVVAAHAPMAIRVIGLSNEATPPVPVATTSRDMPARPNTQSRSPTTVKIAAAVAASASSQPAAMASIPASASAAAPSAVASAEGPAFSMGRLLDLLGIPLETGDATIERNFTGANTLPPAPDYLTSQQFEGGPQPVAEISPVYPESAAGRSGVVVLRLLIGETGTVDEAAVLQALPPDVFDASAVIAFLGARFAPATLHGEPVKSQITIEVQFAPADQGLFSPGRH